MSNAHKLLRRPTLAVVTAVALTAVACGEKPRPKPAPATGAAIGAPSGSSGAPGSTGAAQPSEPARPPERTRGGVDLTAALESAGDAREQVFEAADLLWSDRAAGVTRLVAQKTAAKATVLALLESLSLDELIGAMLVLQAEGDPTGARVEAREKVFAALSHEVGAVRDAAWRTAALIADGAALAKLLPTLPNERKLAVVRLLANWDGQPVEEALWTLVMGADAELALEAALAASAPGKRLTDTMAERLATLLMPETDAAKLRLGLIMYRRLDPHPDKRGAAKRKAAIDRALQSKDEGLMLEGVRSTLTLPPAERTPLYEQLVLDPRTAVRAVTAEVLASHDAKERAALVAKLLQDPEGDVRMAAASARARFGTTDDKLAALSALLSERHRGVRLAAAMLLAQPDSPELIDKSIDLLVKQLDREDNEGRKSILGALASSGRRSALTAVIDMIGDADKKRAVAAHFAIKTATGEDFEDDVAAWRRWLDKRHPPPPPPDR